MGFWNNISGLYDIAESCFNGKAYKAMTEGVRQVVPEGGYVLDCAAGTGELTVAAAEKAGTVLCTDTSLAMLEKAKKKCERKGIENVRFAERNILHTEDPDEIYDAVIAGNVLHLLHCPEAAVRELLRITRKGGRIILPTFLTHGVGTAAEAALKVYRLLGYRSERDFDAEGYLQFLKDCLRGEDGCHGKLKMTVLKGAVPIGFALIQKI